MRVDLFEYPQIERGAVIVLLSGGWDSTYCLIDAYSKTPTARLVPLFCNYGQPYFEEEARAVHSICAGLHLTEQLRICEFAQHQPSIDGAFHLRNFSLLYIAALSHPEAIYFGSRNLLPIFDRYGDSNWLWAGRASKMLGVPIITPCTALPKRVIVDRVRAAMPNSIIYSTEKGKYFGLRYADEGPDE